jgi:hypothetical protein
MENGILTENNKKEKNKMKSNTNKLILLGGLVALVTVIIQLVKNNSNKPIDEDLICKINIIEIPSEVDHTDNFFQARCYGTNWMSGYGDKNFYNMFFRLSNGEQSSDYFPIAVWKTIQLASSHDPTALEIRKEDNSTLDPGVYKIQWNNVYGVGLPILNWYDTGYTVTLV